MASIAPPIWYGQCQNLKIPGGPFETWNPFEAFLDIYHGTKLTLQCYQQGLALNESSTFLGELWAEARYFCRFDASAVIIVLVLTVVWTVMRYLLVKFAFKPYAKSVGVLPHNMEKFGESAWKFLAYLIMWSLAVYMTFFRGYDYFFRPAAMFEDGLTVHSDLLITYALETSYYFHAIYATLFMDVWRKDSVVMLLHHFVTLWLVTFSYSISAIKMGVLIFVLDDIADVVLEAGKICSYMRRRSTGFSRIFGILCDVISVIFVCQWAVLRLYFHVTKAWRSGTIGLWMSLPTLPLPMHIIFIIFLSILYVLYVYWFVFIMMFVVRVVSGNSASAEDPREDDGQPMLQQNGDVKTKHNSIQNGKIRG